MPAIFPALIGFGRTIREGMCFARIIKKSITVYVKAFPVQMILCLCRDPVYDFAWLQSKTGTEAMTVSSDGRVLW